MSNALVYQRIHTVRAHNVGVWEGGGARDEVRPNNSRHRSLLSAAHRHRCCNTAAAERRRKPRAFGSVSRVSRKRPPRRHLLKENKNKFSRRPRTVTKAFVIVYFIRAPMYPTQYTIFDRRVYTHFKFTDAACVYEQRVLTSDFTATDAQ